MSSRLCLEARKSWVGGSLASLAVTSWFIWGVLLALLVGLVWGDGLLGMLHRERYERR